MPQNRNPKVVDLITWHGHESGGVRLPFSSSGGNPLKTPAGDRLEIPTAIGTRLRELAGSLAEKKKAPRAVFLVGGPGNGKSEAVETFVAELDMQLQLKGALLTAAAKKFTPNPLVPWEARITND